MFGAKELLGTLVSSGLGGATRKPDFEAPAAQETAAQESGSGSGNLIGSIVSSLRGGSGTPSSSGGSFSQAASSGVGQAASLLMLGTLAYKAYQSYQGRTAQAPAQAPVGAERVQAIPAQSYAGQAPASAGGAAEDLSHDDAQILIRAMIAAANADGHIDRNEETRIYQILDQSGATQEQRRFVADEIRAPASVDELARAATTREMATHIYAASLLGVDDHNVTSQAYLRYLAARLGLGADAIAGLHGQLGVPQLN
jgi:uncharacterized membrane protein YebE (DUF533 family)